MKGTDYDIHESILIPGSGSFLDSGQESLISCLPDYANAQVSFGPKPLTLTDCHEALLSTIGKARLIGFEIARMKKPFFTLKSKSITLQGDLRELDVLLLSLNDQIVGALNIKTLQVINMRLEDLLRTLVGVDDDFNDSSAKLKASVLRIEKNFGQSVVEPLKNAMINRSTPDFPNLKVHATHCQEQILPTSELWREEVGRLILKIMATEGWHEASGLSKKIDDLLEQAEEAGWDPDEDEKFEELDESNAFQRPDGPSSIITYLNSVLSSDKYQSPKRQGGPSTAHS